MATMLKPREFEAEQPETDHLSAFLADLGELSRRHGIALSNGASLYVMEQEDYSRSYLADNESELTFA